MNRSEDNRSQESEESTQQRPRVQQPVQQPAQNGNDNTLSGSNSSSLLVVIIIIVILCVVFCSGKKETGGVQQNVQTTNQEPGQAFKLTDSVRNNLNRVLNTTTGSEYSPSRNTYTRYTLRR